MIDLFLVGNAYYVSTTALGEGNDELEHMREKG